MLRHINRAIGTIVLVALLGVGIINLIVVLGGSFYLSFNLLDGLGSQEAASTIAAIVGVLGLMVVPVALGVVVFGTLRGAERYMLMIKYLGRKLFPLFAMAGVTLCTAMVIIVISVMGGFLSLMSEAAQKLTGDITLRAGLAGFPHYEEIIAELEKQEEVVAATPLIRTFGLLNLQGDVEPVEVMGIQPEGLDAVVGYRGALYWNKQRMQEEREFHSRNESPQGMRDGFERRAEILFNRYDLEKLGMSLETPPQWVIPEKRDDDDESKSDRQEPRHGIVLGIELDNRNRRTKEGTYLLVDNWSLTDEVTLTVMPISDRGTPLDTSVERFNVVNEFKSGLYEIDNNRVYVPFDVLQKMLQMEESKAYDRIDPETLKPIGDPTIIPGRTTEIAIRGAEGIELGELLGIVRSVAGKIQIKHEDTRAIYAMTWRQQHGTLLGAVRNEKRLLTFLFGIISLVAIVMIAVIFCMIVMDKTRDIGTLRAIGASRGGVMSIFLGYGLTVGLIGSGLGLILAASVVLNLNEIHAWLAHGMGVWIFGLLCVVAGLVAGVILGAVFGAIRKQMLIWMLKAGLAFAVIGAIVAVSILMSKTGFSQELNETISVTIWDPRVYFFDRIPTRLDNTEVFLIMTVAVCSSVIGSLIPAMLAGKVDPVRALRYE